MEAAITVIYALANTMGSRLKFAALVSIAILALGASVLLLYSYVSNDWRLTKGILDVRLFTSPEEEFDNRIASRRWELDLADGGTVAVDASGANVNVVRGTGSKAVVEIWLEGETTDSTQFETKALLENPSFLRVTARSTSRWLTPQLNAVRITITLAGHNDLQVKCLGGTATIDAISGSITADVTGRDLTLLGVTGRIVLKCLHGNISIERGSISGSINASHGGVDMNYTDGDITISATADITARNHQGRLYASSTEGKVNAELVGMNVECRLIANKGDVDLSLLPDARATLDIETGSGQVYAMVPLDTTAMTARPNLLRATMNGGGSPVMIRASSGNAYVHEHGEPITLPTLP